MRRPHLSLRGRAIVYFGLASFSVAVLFAVATYVLAHQYLLHQRLSTVEHRATADAQVVSARTEAGATAIDKILETLDPLSSSSVIVHSGTDWYASARLGPRDLPPEIVAAASRGETSVTTTTVNGRPAVVAGTPLATGGELFEIASLDEFERTRAILLTVFVVGVVLVTALGILLARWFSGRLFEPLEAMTRAAADIAGGALDLRLDQTDDQDLATLVASFNSMVETLQTRIERDARFAADVSHELRTPLATLVAATDMLVLRRDELSPRQQAALDLVESELGRFQHLLDDLIELARIEAGTELADAAEVDLSQLLRETLDRSGRRSMLVEPPDPVVLVASKRLLERIFWNLIDNADRHGRGLTAVRILEAEGWATVLVDDEGPGISAGDRQRIFDRFSSMGTDRGSTAGTGLGLAIVREAVHSLGGQVWAVTRPGPGGGARFTVRLPLAPDELSLQSHHLARARS